MAATARAIVPIVVRHGRGVRPTVSVRSSETARRRRLDSRPRIRPNPDEMAATAADPVLQGMVQVEKLALSSEDIVSRARSLQPPPRTASEPPASPISRSYSSESDYLNGSFTSTTSTAGDDSILATSSFISTRDDEERSGPAHPAAVEMPTATDCRPVLTPDTLELLSCTCMASLQCRSCPCSCSGIKEMVTPVSCTE